MFLPSTILVTWHSIVITWSVARMKTTTLKMSICPCLHTIILKLGRHDPRPKRLAYPGQNDMLKTGRNDLGLNEPGPKRPGTVSYLPSYTLSDYVTLPHSPQGGCTNNIFGERIPSVHKTR